MIKTAAMRVLAVLCVAVLAVTCVPMSVFAAYENTHVNTGDQAADIVAVAETQVGYLEGSLAGTTAGSNNYTKYGKWYADYFSSPGFAYGAWCAMFVSWCANQAGIPSSIMYYHASCTTAVREWKNRGLFHARSGYTPKAGDIIYFGSGNESTHVGIVRYVSGGYVYTIEGNTSGQNGEVNEGGGCFKKSYSLSYSRILGYASPNYEQGSSAAKIGTYVITASSLNVRTSANTSGEIVGVLDNGDIVYISELSNGWGKVTLPDGVSGWCAIGDYGNYIGVDVLSSTGARQWGDATTTLGEDGSLTIVNRSGTDTVGYDFTLPVALGVNTTPFMTMQVTPNSGDGYYFGITQAGSGYFMMRDKDASDPLVQTDQAPFITTPETLEIDLRDLWTHAEYRVDTVRFYVAPLSSVTINYCYFAANSNTVRDTSYNLSRGDGQNEPPVLAQSNINLMDPASLRIVDTDKTGSYTYNNGTLTVTSGDAELYEVAFDINKEFTPEELQRLLFSVDANVRYDIELVVTTSEGDRVVSLAKDFWPEVCTARDGDFIPAAKQSAGLSLYSVYTFNDVMPADGKSVVKTVTVQVGGYGAVTVEAIQINDTDALKVFADDVYKHEESNAPSEGPTVGDVNNDGEITTSDARVAMLYALTDAELSADQFMVADYNGDGEVTTTDARLMMLQALSN